MKRSSYSCPGDWTGNHLKASSWTKIKTAALTLQRDSISNYGTFLLSSANLSSYLLSPLFQEPGSTLRTWGTGLAAQTQFLCKPARSCISLQNPSPWLWVGSQVWRSWPAVASFAGKAILFLFIPSSVFTFYFGSEAQRSLYTTEWILGEENLLVVFVASFSVLWPV